MQEEHNCQLIIQYELAIKLACSTVYDGVGGAGREKCLGDFRCKSQGNLWTVKLKQL